LNTDAAKCSDAAGRLTGVFSAASANAKGGHAESSMFGAWFRDNCLVAYGLYISDPNGQGAADAVACVNAIAAFLLRTQTHKLELVINGHKHVKGGEDTWMDRPHIRFVGETGEEDKKWYNHKQNDALGYFLWLRSVLARDQKLPFDGEHLKLVAMIFDYLRAIESWADHDGGHWEEHSAVHSSSLGPVLAAVRVFKAVAAREGYLVPCREGTLDVLESRSAEALAAALPNEIITPASLARDADSACVFLCYPLDVVDRAMGLRIIERLRKCMGHIGVCRYRSDSYWCKDYKDRVGDDPTKHFTDDELKARDALLRDGEEAQWCIFDPMLSAYHGTLYRATGEAAYLELQMLHLSRALAAITPDDCEFGGWHAAEAYYLQGSVWRSNDNCPLVWTQANIKVALHEMKLSIEANRNT